MKVLSILVISALLFPSFCWGKGKWDVIKEGIQQLERKVEEAQQPQPSTSTPQPVPNRAPILNWVSPVDNTTDAATSTIVSWSATDPDEDPLRYDVYFGVQQPPSLVSSNQVATSYNPGILATGTTYYWRVTARDSRGSETSTSVLRFTTIIPTPPPQPQPNQAPYVTLVGPVNNATNVATATIILWTGGDPDNDVVTYDVYFAAVNPPTLVVANQIATTYNPGLLLGSTTYYWKIVVKDSKGSQTISTVWQFATIIPPPPPPVQLVPLKGLLKQVDINGYYTGKSINMSGIWYNPVTGSLTGTTGNSEFGPLSFEPSEVAKLPSYMEVETNPDGIWPRVGTSGKVFGWARFINGTGTWETEYGKWGSCTEWLLLRRPWDPDGGTDTTKSVYTILKPDGNFWGWSIADAPLYYFWWGSVYLDPPKSRSASTASEYQVFPLPPPKK